MNKKFLSAILFGALVASAGSFVSCADNGDDIKQLQDQNGELKAQLAQLKSELQAELKNAASASQVAALEAKLSAIEGVTSENIAAVVAALKGDFNTQEAKVVALEAQIKAIESAQLDNASAVLEAINKAKENSNADMAAISALVDALDADVNVLVSALRSLVFQPEFYVDGIEAAEYTYLRYVALWEKGDVYALTTASSDEVSHDIWMYAPGGTTPYAYDRKNIKMGIKGDFKWQYAHTGDLATVSEDPATYNASSLLSCKDEENKFACGHDNCVYTSDDCGIAIAKKGSWAKTQYVGENILNTVTFAKNPANAKVSAEDATLAVKNIMAMTRANEATMKVVSIDETTKPGYAIVTYYIADPAKVITANHDEEYGVLNKVENTTIFKLQAGAYDGTTVESDWAALYETSIQPVAVAINKNAQAGHAAEKDSKWTAPIACTTYNELHKNPYEAADALARTAEIDYLSQGVNIAEHIELHFVKRDSEKATHKHNPTASEVQHPHVTMTLAEAAYKFGFTYEFNMVPFIIDDNKTNNSAYAHLVKAEGLDEATYGTPVIIPNTVEEDPKLVKGTPWNLIPKKAVDNSTNTSWDGYEQGASSVDREPLVQVLVKKGDDVILDAYVSFIITRTVGNVLAPVFDLGSQAKSCDYLHYSMTWNQVSELLYEQTANKGLGMSKLEFEESYELVTYGVEKVDPIDGIKKPVIAQWTNLKVDEEGNVVADAVKYENTYSNIFQEFDPNGIATTTLHTSLDKYDQQYVYEKPGFKTMIVEANTGKLVEKEIPARTDIVYVMYVRKGLQKESNHSTLHGILVPMQIALDEVKALEYSEKNINYWYDKTGKPNILDSIGINHQSIRLNVNYALDKGDTYTTENGTLNDEKFNGVTVEGFVRDLDDAWDGKALKVGDKKVKTQANYYFHPLTKNVVVTDEYSGVKYQLDVDSESMFCAIWVMGDDPINGEGVDKHEHLVSGEISKKDPGFVKQAEKDNNVDVTKGIYTNTKLYAYEVGKKDATRTLIAEMNGKTGDVHYMYNDMSKKVLNATNHRAAEEFAYVGIYLANECNIAKYINYNDVPENVFAAYWLRPLDIQPCDNDTVIDATNNAYYISIFDKYNFSDWRDYSIVDKTKKPMDYKNVWLLAFYGVKYMTLNLDKVTTTMNKHNIDTDLLTSVNQDIKISYVEHNKTTVIGKLGEVATKTINLSTYNKESMGVKSTYDAIVNHFGYLKYENKGANVSNFKFRVPVTFGYDWGEITTTFEIQVIGTEGNHDGEEGKE